MISNTAANAGLTYLDMQTYVGITKYIGRRAAILLALLLITACSTRNEIQSTEGQALVERGNTYMVCLKDSDLKCAYDLLSPSAQQVFDTATGLTKGVIDLESALKTYGPKISAWTFDRVQFTTWNGTTIGSLEGEVVHMDGERSKLSLEFEKDGGIWKVRSSDIELNSSDIAKIKKISQ